MKLGQNFVKYFVHFLENGVNKLKHRKRTSFIQESKILEFQANKVKIYQLLVILEQVQSLTIFLYNLGKFVKFSGTILGWTAVGLRTIAPMTSNLISSGPLKAPISG